MAVTYTETKAFRSALQKEFLLGGSPQKRARRDLGDGWRLVRTQDDKVCTFVFVGDHEDTDRWLNNHKGEIIGSRHGMLVRVPGTASADRDAPVQRYAGAKSLLGMLEDAAADELTAGLSGSMVRVLDRLDQGSAAHEVASAAAVIADDQQREFVEGTLQLLRQGDVDGACARIDLKFGRITPVEDLDDHDHVQIADGEDVRRIRVGSAEYAQWLEGFERRSSWQDWFLFLHPDQTKVVEADYAGSAQLSGVSGSGKTCVLVRRALRLAEQADGPVLLVTLNRSLAGMLGQLVDSACVDPTVRARLEVVSFFELAQRLLGEFEPDRARLYNDVTWKLNEHVDEVFREYYRKWANNEDAGVLEGLHRSCNARGVSGEAYLRGEFDWIRSAAGPDRRATYLTLERKGRRFPIPEDRRRDVLDGLAGWERKMAHVGVVDYLGLTSALSRWLSKITPRYAHVLVDEAQDFGTTELAVVRALARPGPNDLFLAGDVAQTVLPKHRSLGDAGVALVARERIRQNYRNSREILRAAHDLLLANLHEELFESEGLEVLDPRFANFCGPVPVALAADSLAEEIAYARTYARTLLEKGVRTVCIALAGFSARDVSAYAQELGERALDGAYDPGQERLVFSDLEQTKG